MSGEIYKTIQNIEYHIESINPTYSSRNAPGFQSINDMPELDESVLHERCFLILYDGKDETEAISDGFVDISNHRFTIETYYPSEGIALNFMNEQIAADQRDIINAMQDGAKKLGIAGSISENCGIMAREVQKTKIERTETHWVLIVPLVIKICEEAL